MCLYPYNKIANFNVEKKKIFTAKFKNIKKLNRILCEMYSSWIKIATGQLVAVSVKL